MTQYSASSIEVLAGLEPVRKRPGMYTDTARPNHLVQEVIDNSVDEALAGHAKKIGVRLFEDGGVEVSDDGRGMPIDIHPEHGVSGIELIMTKLHAGGKFSNSSYRFSGGLHGVGVSVVNALSKRLEVEVLKGGERHGMAFEHGELASPLEVIGTAAKRATGTTLRFRATEAVAVAAQAPAARQGGALPGPRGLADRGRRHPERVAVRGWPARLPGPGHRRL